VTNKAVLIAVVVFGLVVGICGGLEQTILGRSIYLIHEASKKKEIEQVMPQLAEIRQGLDTSYSLTTASMYFGVAVGIAATIGLGFSFPSRRAARRKPAVEMQSAP